MGKRVRLFVLSLVLCFCTAFPSAQIRYELVSRDVIESRLKSFSRKNEVRWQTMKKLFAESGCTADKLTEQQVPHLKEPNLICTLPGASDSQVIVGAHFDASGDGDGVADNWSGAALLPTLYDSLRGRALQHTYVFIAFSGEEKGLVGSEYYAKKLSTEEKARIRAMVNMDTLGLSPTKIWVSHSDKNLVDIAARLANAMKIPVAGVNAEQVGSTDSESFFQRKIPTICFHSLTQESFRNLHSLRDNLSNFRFDDYYESYRLISAYITYLDGNLPVQQKEPAATKPAKP